ncbi:hypothetical protein Trydic_g8391 [Trypoxylus dichotomus]
MCVTGKDNNKSSDSMETSVSVKNTLQDTDTVNKKRQAPVSTEPCGSEDRADEPFIQEPTENPFKVFIKPCVKKKKPSVTISDDCPNFKEFQHLFESGSQAVSYEQMCEYLQEVKDQVLHRNRKPEPITIPRRFSNQETGWQLRHSIPKGDSYQPAQTQCAITLPSRTDTKITNGFTTNTINRAFHTKKKPTYATHTKHQIQTNGNVQKEMNEISLKQRGHKSGNLRV